MSAGVAEGEGDLGVGQGLQVLISARLGLGVGVVMSSHGGWLLLMHTDVWFNQRKRNAGGWNVVVMVEIEDGISLAVEMRKRQKTGP